ncbi:MAG TPA: CoA-binding protein [Acidimicrobiales bacterium]|nr:CoA-binding protein [Acidimicrobiales bacterium]
MTVGAAQHDSAESPGPWHPPSARERLQILNETRTVAVVGASSNPARASYFVATYLLSSSTDYIVWFVNPQEQSILGRPVYPTLADLPESPDLVDVFRRASDLPEVAAEAIAVKARTFWAQLGLWNDEAAEAAHAAGLHVVMNRCLKIEHARFAGGLHLAGFDTGVINAKRPIRPGPRPD